MNNQSHLYKIEYRVNSSGEDHTLFVVSSKTMIDVISDFDKNRGPDTIFCATLTKIEMMASQLFACLPDLTYNLDSNDTEDETKKGD